MDQIEFFGTIPDRFELFIDGDLEEAKLVAAYVADNQCHGFFAANRESQTAILLDSMRREGPPALETVRTILKAGR
ncbi:MAG: hypothetical protein JOZ31_11340 [Verrucomicrobia bacterium]|nr:hypothetical protein [Verrucomicrobiota bacterium]MBV8483436.1 hypothetical protein [Verrucomicrobiota bacterium]